MSPALLHVRNTLPRPLSSNAVHYLHYPGLVALWLCDWPGDSNVRHYDRPVMSARYVRTSEKDRNREGDATWAAQATGTSTRAYCPGVEGRTPTLEKRMTVSLLSIRDTACFRGLGRDLAMLVVRTFTLSKSLG